MAREYVDISVELTHLYLRDIDEDPSIVERALDSALFWLKPILHNFESRGQTVGTCVLIDDYFIKSDLVVDPEKVAELFRNACEKADVPLDHIVFEKACADTVETMLGLIVEEPRPGAGSRGGARDNLRPARDWLSNGDAMRLTYSPAEGRLGQDWFNGEQRQLEPKNTHAVFLDVQLYDESDGDRRYSCPALAAWWQLIRLGLDRNSDGAKRIPAGTQSRDGARPLFGKRTLTLLPPQFIEIEHAVNNILRQVAIPHSLLRKMRDKKQPIPLDAKPISDRVSYIVADPDFHV